MRLEDLVFNLRRFMSKYPYFFIQRHEEKQDSLNVNLDWLTLLGLDSPFNFSYFLKNLMNNLTKKNLYELNSYKKNYIIFSFFLNTLH